MLESVIVFHTEVKAKRLTHHKAQLKGVFRYIVDLFIYRNQICHVEYKEGAVIITAVYRILAPPYAVAY